MEFYLNLTVGKITIATVVLAAAVAYCEWLATVIAPDHWAYGFAVNFAFLAAFTAVLTALELPILPDSYFSPKSFELNGRIYRWTGIQAFVAFLRLIGWERFWRKSIPVLNDRTALRKYSDSTRGSEAVHMTAAVFTAVFTLTVAFRHSFVGTMWLWGFNVLVNAYPVMLQRYNRPRVDRLLRRLERNTESTEQ
jgi:hypothetical protein